jgi:hypothetical protein
MDDLEAAVAALLRQGPASWTPSPSESPDALRLLTQAGFIERRLTFTLRMPGQDAQYRITIEATGEFGLVEALEPVLQDLWAKGKDHWQALSQEVGTVKPIVAVEADEWRITEHGRLAQQDLARGNQRPIDFVLKRGFFDGRPRPLPNGQVTRRLPVRGTGRLVRIENAQDRPLAVDVAKFSAAAELAEAFAAAFASVQLPGAAKSAAQEAAPQPPQPAAAEPATGALSRLAAIYGPVVAKLANLQAIIDNPKATVEDKLAELSRHAPIPDDLTAEQIAKALGVHKSAVIRTRWWRSRQARLDAERSCRRDDRRGTLD